MKAEEFYSFLEKKCRFKMRSGKEVYGVIWEEMDNSKEHYFASSEEYLAFKIAKAKEDRDTCDRLKLKVNIEDVISIECLEDKR